MAENDGRMKLVQVTAREALALQLGARAAACAGEAVRRLRYPAPTPDQWRRIQRELGSEAIAAALLLPDLMPELTDEQLDEAAELSANAVVREVLGPPRAEALQ